MSVGDALMHNIKGQTHLIGELRSIDRSTWHRLPKLRVSASILQTVINLRNVCFVISIMNRSENETLQPG